MNNDLKWSPMMQEIIEEKRKHLQLYEGLITSYPIEQVMQIISNKINKLKKIYNPNNNISGYKIKIKYLRTESNNLSLPNISIFFIITDINKDFNNDNYIYIDDVTLYLELEKIMNTCGWFSTVIKDSKNNSIDNFKNNIFKIIFRAKFDVNLHDKEKWPEFLYHLTPSKNIDKIFKQGLIPKAENKKVKHQDSIHIFNYGNNYDKTKYLANELRNNSKIKYNSYIILKIDIKKIPFKNFFLYVDPDMEDGYFTKDNIPPNIIESIYEINF